MIGVHGSRPLGWTVLALVVVAYAHVILELAAAGLALAIAARIVTAVPIHMLVDRVMSRRHRRGPSGRDAVATGRPTPDAAPREPRRDPSAEWD